MILFLEIIVSLVLYTYFMVQSSKKPLDIIYDYPPKIVKRVEEMRLVDTRKRKTSIQWLNTKIIIIKILLIIEFQTIIKSIVVWIGQKGTLEV